MGREGVRGAHIGWVHHKIMCLDENSTQPNGHAFLLFYLMRNSVLLIDKKWEYTLKYANEVVFLYSLCAFLLRLVQLILNLRMFAVFNNPPETGHMSNVAFFIQGFSH